MAAMRVLPLGFSWAAFLVYFCALCFVVLGGMVALIESHHPAFLAPILVGLFYFYLTWEAVVEPDLHVPPPPPPQRDGA
jgi:hypothetical protein